MAPIVHKGNPRESGGAKFDRYPCLRQSGTTASDISRYSTLPIPCSSFSPLPRFKPFPPRHAEPAFHHRIDRVRNRAHIAYGTLLTVSGDFSRFYPSTHPINKIPYVIQIISHLVDRHLVILGLIDFCWCSAPYLNAPAHIYLMISVSSPPSCSGGISLDQLTSI